MTLTKQQLELAALAAVERIMRSGSAEDDFIEAKREWPTTAKARQLAGAANRAAGEHLIYLIGIDEKTREITPSTGVEPADWWAQMKSRFDQVAPDLVRFVQVHITETDVVTALLFETDQAPYVVKVGGVGPSEKEIPIRDGTGTRSARRDEIMRMLAPAVSLPPAELRWAQLSGQRRKFKPADRPGQKDQLESVLLDGGVRLEFGHVAAPVFLPDDAMDGEVTGGDLRYKFKLMVNTPTTPGPPTFGIHPRSDGVAITSPGQLKAWLLFDRPEIASFAALQAVEEWTMRLRIGVTGAPLDLRFEATLRLAKFAEGRGPYFEDLPEWRFGKEHR